MDSNKNKSFLSVLTVDHNSERQKQLNLLLTEKSEHKIKVFAVSGVEAAYRKLDTVKIDCIFVDYYLEGSTASEFLDVLSYRLVDIPVIVITDRMNERQLAEELLTRGANDIIQENDLENANFGRIIRNALLRQIYSNSLKATANTDQLTCLMNRSYFLARLQNEIDRAQRTRESLSVLFCDLNGFKALNDALGHMAGDDALHEFGQIIQTHTRRYDVAARMGGDEFAILLTSTSAEQAQVVITSIQRLTDEAFSNKYQSLSVAIGATTYDGSINRSAEKLVSLADKAMYVEKRKMKQERESVRTAPHKDDLFSDTEV